MNAIRLRCESLKNPLGIDVQRPRLMWNAEGCVKQTAYQIVTENRDSGKVETSSLHARYPKELKSREGTGARGGIASLNHYSRGAVCEWLFKTVCGIRADGENHFRITPRPGGHFTFAKAKYDSICGTIASGWARKEGKTVYSISIPAKIVPQRCSLREGRRSRAPEPMISASLNRSGQEIAEQSPHSRGRPLTRRRHITAKAPAWFFRSQAGAFSKERLADG